MQFSQHGFVLKRIHLRDASLHEQKDAMLGLARKMLGFGRQRTFEIRLVIRHKVILQQTRQTEGANAVPCRDRKSRRAMPWLV